MLVLIRIIKFTVSSIAHDDAIEAYMADILRVFDMTSKYGPSVGISRLQRWERAKKWGLNPPTEVSICVRVVWADS